MNNRLELLNLYPFEKLKQLIANIYNNKELDPIYLQIGEPLHKTSKIIIDALKNNLDKISKYPSTIGTLTLREACANWLRKRYQIDLDPNTQIIPTNGSREALFNFIQSAIDINNNSDKVYIVCPNPFYQIYEGATILAGAKIKFLPYEDITFKPKWDEIDDNVWENTQIVIVCNPNNPTGAIFDIEDWKKIFLLQEKYGFIIVSDECYSEIYFDYPPLGILNSSLKLGFSLDNKMMFTSLSKRSNVPGMRSGFVAGDSKLIKKFLLYRTYCGTAMSELIQAASIAAWNDEKHVIRNRKLYKEKFDKVIPILSKKFNVQKPSASFYIWLKLNNDDDLTFTKNLWIKKSVLVLPGRFLSREDNNKNPGIGYVRIALVSTVDNCVEAANRIIEFIN